LVVVAARGLVKLSTKQIARALLPSAESLSYFGFLKGNWRQIVRKVDSFQAPVRRPSPIVPVRDDAGSANDEIGTW
jgi:hypothetical protein